MTTRCGGGWRMLAMTAGGETTERLSPRTRALVVWGLVGLGALILLVGSLTVWVDRQAVDTDAWVDTSTQLLEDDEVRDALSLYLVDQLYQNIDVQARLEQRLPPDLEGLSGPLAGALRSPAEQAVGRILERPRVQALWETVNRTAHETLIRVLEDETREGVSTAGGEVTLDLRLFLVDIGTELGFGEQLDERLPADAGQITVLESDELASAQTALKALKALSWLLVIAALAAFGGALALTRTRREVLRTIGIVFVLVGIVLLVVRRAVGSYVVDALAAGESVRDAVGSSWVIGTSLLAQVAWALIIYGVVMLVGALLAGPAGVARRLRHEIAPGLRDRPAIGWTVLAATFLLLVLWAPVPALETWGGVLLLGALVALGFEAFRRLTVAELEPGGSAPALPGAEPAS
ncbi:MAG TPA: hypothetical protein VFY02_10440 [Gaiellaceae bacterium]|nr:hypothetical protein [Gaiellaceae bacterium]